MFSGKNKTAKKIITDTRSNKFLDAIIKTLNRPSKNGHTPDASDIFKELMEFYIRISQETYLHVFPAHFFNHVDDAKKCLSFFNQEDQHKHKALTESIDYLSNQQANNALKRIDINIDGSFGLLLSTFFAMFPEKLIDCSDELRNKIKKLDLWNHAITKGINDFITTHRAGGGSHDHETLEYLSTVVPDAMVEPYVHFLMASLHNTNRHESVKGLYKGWIYAALGRLFPRMSHTTQTIVNNLLVRTFKSRQQDLSLIGLCQALASANISDDQLKEVADRLYNYTMDELKNLAKLHEDHQPATTTLYMEKLFLTLKKMEHMYNADRRNGLINPMIDSPEFLYTLRRSISIMEDWIPAAAKLKIMESLPIHEDALTLAPMFWHWLSLDKNYQTPWAQSNQFSRVITQARRDLMDIFDNDSCIADQVRLLIADNTTRTDMRTDIIDNLMSDLIDFNKDGIMNNVRRELHQALVAIKPWAEASQRITIAKLLLLGTRPTSGDNEEVRVSAARAAAEYSDLFTPAEAVIFKNSVLPLLDSTHADKAAAALQVFAAKRIIDELPELLTCLLTKNSAHAQLLLATLHKTYMTQDRVIERKIRIAI